MQRQTEAHARDFNTELGITQLKALLGMWLGLKTQLKSK
jgi:hypothetical protein